MVSSFLVPLFENPNSNSSSVSTVENQTSYCDKIFDNEDSFSDDNLCRRCKIHHELLHALRMLGCTDSKYFSAARNLETGEEHFVIPRHEDEKMDKIIPAIFQKAMKGYKNIERLGEMAYGFPNELTVRTTKIICEGRCGQGVRYKFAFGDEVVEEVLEQYMEGRRGVKTKAGERIAVDCMWYGRKSEAVCGGC
jgi:hypothetical protein